MGAQEQRNSRNERNSRSRETATLRTASPSIFLEWGGGGREDRSDSASRSLRTADVSSRLSPLRTSLKGDEREEKRLPFAGYASRVRNKRSMEQGNIRKTRNRGAEQQRNRRNRRNSRPFDIDGEWVGFRGWYG